MPSVHALRIGSAVGGYQIVRVIGEGGFGITYEAVNVVTGYRVAVKEFFPTGFATRNDASQLVYSQAQEAMVSWALEKFKATTTQLCRLQHPNILRVLDYMPGNNTGYMLMELLSGATLAGWLAARRGGLAPRAAPDPGAGAGRPRLRARTRPDPPRHRARQHLHLR